MATYRVSPLGSNTSPYDTWAKAANDITTILALALTGSNLILVDEGTYSGPASAYLNCYGAKYANLSILGSKYGETGGVEASRDTVIFNAGAGQTCLQFNQAGFNIENVTLNADDGSFSILGNGATGCVLRNVDVDDGQIYMTNCTYTFDRITSNNSSDAVVSMLIIGSSSGIMYYPAVTGGGKYSRYGMRFNSSGNNTIVNGIITNTEQYGIYHNNAGDLNIYNLTLGACCLAFNVEPIFSNATGDLNVYNTALLPGGVDPDAHISGAEIESNNLENPNLKLNTYEREGYIVPSVDDAGRLYYAEDLAELLDTYGYKGTWYLEGGNWDKTYLASTPDMRTMIAAGTMEVANHSWSHSPPAATVAITVSYSGADTNPTVALVAGTPRNIQLRTTEGNDDADINLSTYPTLEEIEGAIDALSIWSAEITNLVGGVAKETSLDVVSAQAAPYGLLFLTTDETEGYFKDECADSKTYLTDLVNALGDVTDGQTGETYVCNSFATPYTFGDSDYIDSLKAVGHTSCRKASFRAGLSSLDHYDIVTVHVSELLVSGDKEATQVKTRAIAQNAALGGMVIYLYAHSEAEATMTEWSWIIDVFPEFSNISVTSSQLAIVDIISKADSYDSGTGISVRTFTLQTDFSILNDSECIDVGLNTPLSGVVDIKDIERNEITDDSGNIVAEGGTVDIGAVEFQGIGSGVLSSVFTNVFTKVFTDIL